ncbi:MAG: hypothetical protein H6591_02070 [Flavobacteriales bacterium]|nr:hypothetical protein [Flavobacteriales bacterium]
MLRKARNLLLAFAALLALGFGVLLVLANVYEDEVKARLLGAVNERLRAPVSVGAIDLTLIARFPMASLRLRDVKVDEVRTDSLPADTLLTADEVFLEFNLLALFGGSQTVERIHTANVALFPALDRNGVENYIIWRSDSASASSPVELERLTFDGLHVRFTDARNGLHIAAESEDLLLAGRFGEESQLRAEGDVHLLSLERDGKSLLDERRAQLALDMSFGKEAFQISKGEVQLGKVPLQLTLALTQGAKGREIDLRANGLGLDLGRVMEQLPASIQGPMKRFGLSGGIDLAIKYAGSLEGDGPPLSIGAQVSQGRMKERTSGTQFTEINGELAMDIAPDGSIRKLKVKDLSARSGSGSLRADWSSGGVKKAPVKADIRCDIAIADLLRMAGVDTLEQAAGRFVADIKVDGTLRDMADLRVSDLKAVRVTGHAALRDAGLKLKGVRHRVEHLDAELALNGNDATVRGLKADIAGSPIELSGTLRNLVPYALFEQEHLVIEAKGRSPRIDLGALLQGDESGHGTAYALVLPAAIELDLRAQVDELVFEDFKATGINGTIRMKDRVLRASPLSFATADGAVLGSLELDARGGGSASWYPLAIEADVKDIAIQQLFAEFRDFGQEFIGQRHLSGRARASIAFRAPLSPAMRIDRDRIACTIDIAVENGGIKGQGQLIAVADYLKKNKLVAPFVDTEELRRRLADVRFAKLENRVEIKDGAVHVPLMEVRSNALDIELSGTHWFDDRIDHHLNFRLGDLFRLGKPTADEFGPIADDGTGMRVFLHMHGTAQAPLFENDGAMAANRRRQQFQQEKQQLRTILREDILGHKSEGTTTAQAPTGGRVIIEQEGDSTRNELVVAPKKPKGRLFAEPKEKKEPGRIIIED